MTEFDLVVIGAGPGGYVAAIKAAQLGLKVACVEKRDTLGGTCLNVGCIPSKALLHSSHKYEEANEVFAEHGINLEKVDLDLSKMMDRKSKVVRDLTKGIDGLFRKNKVTKYHGFGSIDSPDTVTISQEDGSVEKIKTKNILIATGSEPASLPNVNIDEELIVSSTGALSLEKVPEKMLVIGGGVIGLEMGSVWSRLGAQVKIVEFMDRALVGADKEVSKEVQKIMSKKGIEFQLSTKVTSAVSDGKKVTVTSQPKEGGDEETQEYDVVLVAIGRVPYTKGLGLEKLGVKVDERGRVAVNEKFETNVNGIYAIGDTVSGPMLAHKAEEEGIAVAETLAGGKGHVNYNAIASVVYTYPEVAYVGYSEEQLKEQGIEYNVGKFPFMANSRARTNGETDGFVKILACKKTDKVLGAHIIGTYAGELIAELSLGIEFHAAAEDIALTSHSHPGLAEAVKEAALGAFSKPIHI